MSDIVEVPKYLRLAQDLEQTIRSGEWGVGKVPSVREIAKAHNVSVMTASRALQVLRDKGMVNTVERSGCFVTTAGSNVAARFGLVLHVTPGPFHQASLSVTLAGFQAVQRSLKAVFPTDLFTLRPEVSDSDLRSQAKNARYNGVEGVFLLPSRLSEETQKLDERLIAACRAERLPVVLVERNLRGANRPLLHDLVASDDLAGGRLLTRHLIELGRKRIAFVVGSPTSSHLDRLAGYLLEMNAAGLTPLVLTQPSQSDRRDTYAPIAEMLITARSDGVVCYSDYMAMGLVIEMLRYGIPIPGRIALAGFDNVPLGDTFSLGITTYEFPAEAIAAEAVRVLRRRIAEPTAEPIRVVLAGRLIIRNSSIGGETKSIPDG